MKERKIGTWICGTCGMEYGHASDRNLSTWHIGRCDYCGKEKPVTEVRDFGYPELPKKEGE